MSNHFRGQEVPGSVARTQRFFYQEEKGQGRYRGQRDRNITEQGGCEGVMKDKEQELMEAQKKAVDAFLEALK